MKKILKKFLLVLLIAFIAISCKKEEENHIPVVVTTDITSIMETTALSGGEIIDNGELNIIDRGVCWSTKALPTVNDNHTVDSNGTGGFISTITGLSENTNYFLRAYASNSLGTGYGNQLSFSTTYSPSVETSGISNISLISAQSGGKITDDGGNIIIAQGVCWSTSQNPTTNDNHTVDGSDAEGFTSLISGLTENTTYYVRAYAFNGSTTVYGQERILKTYSGTVVDFDGNEYFTVDIGTQTWIAENLRVTHFRNGDPITIISDPELWRTQFEPTMCYYQFDSATYSKTKGAYYNGYTIVDSRELCPSGWHISSDDEWKTLEIYLGMSQSEADERGFRGTNEGSKLKSQVGWGDKDHFGIEDNMHYDIRRNGTNESGFSAIPTGVINWHLAFHWEEDWDAYWWTSTITNDGEWYSRNMTSWNHRRGYEDFTQINRISTTDIRDGASIRCIKD